MVPQQLSQDVQIYATVLQPLTANYTIDTAKAMVYQQNNYRHAQTQPTRKNYIRRFFSVLLLVAVVTLVAYLKLQPHKAAAQTKTRHLITQARVAMQGMCNQNDDNYAVFVRISQQHMWACNGKKQVYDTPVTTGAYQIGDATPTGTWHIFAKETNLYLTGPGYKDWVQYWMPFYTDYGFHDASWQTFKFGNLTQYATQGSRGCVHLPNAAAAWLYNWAPIGTTVTIEA